MTIKYPTWRVNNDGFTPLAMLTICDVCQEANWTTHRVPNIHYCYGYGKNHDVRRIREATQAEYAVARAALNTLSDNMK